MQPDLSSIKDIAIAAQRIRRFVAGVSFDAFLRNEEKRSAVYGQIIILGEAANRVSSSYRAAHPEVPWRKLIGMRNRIVHVYDEVDWDIVWQVADKDLESLLRIIDPLLQEPQD